MRILTQEQRTMMFKSFDELYDVHELDLDLFSTITEDGELIVKEEAMTVFRILRMKEMFDKIFSEEECPYKKISFTDVFLDWILIQTRACGDSDIDTIVKISFHEVGKFMQEKVNKVLDELKRGI
jgi:hypothetical protein